MNNTMDAINQGLGDREFQTQIYQFKRVWEGEMFELYTGYVPGNPPPPKRRINTRQSTLQSAIGGNEEHLLTTATTKPPTHHPVGKP
jgi:hypothetical protein